MSTRDDDDRDYEVGYGRPPKVTRFKKGQSGNPKGRPKEAKGISASLRRELEAKITVTEGQQTRRVSKAEAAAKRLVAKALSGDVKTLLKLIELDPQLFGVNADSTAAEDGAQPEPVDLDLLQHFFTAQQEATRQEGDAEGEAPT
ncbi:hypothetical protein roselon_02112 [Roseibacterium elongatum DSM 19469]|uniref:DUF5681 domain-containing protein n=1 Tax=Roseicyclus elongatus DSM 19469 TaxID=1294273 RepID=W8RTC7_9RHOB|nr:DUF5681 domain-containing protein [Roseibacterium elongatum]AHM04459.1 hypothetical protein roselon_02112 [Roseibacterium elongatum DSM 19469]